MAHYGLVVELVRRKGIEVLTRLEPVPDVLKLPGIDPVTSAEFFIVLIGRMTIVVETKIP